MGCDSSRISPPKSRQGKRLLYGDTQRKFHPLCAAGSTYASCVYCNLCSVLCMMKVLKLVYQPTVYCADSRAVTETKLGHWSGHPALGIDINPGRGHGMVSTTSPRWTQSSLMSPPADVCIFHENYLCCFTSNSHLLDPLELPKKTYPRRSGTQRSQVTLAHADSAIVASYRIAPHLLCLKTFFIWGHDEKTANRQ